MSGLLVPLAVVVVAHHVNVVEVLVQLGNVVGNIDGGSGGTDGRGQDVVVLVQGRSQVPDQGDEVLLVLRFTTAFTCKTGADLMKKEQI